MKIIVGLGNPGKEYEKSRHNAGWMVLDELQKELDGDPFHDEKKFKASICKITHNDEELLLLKPLTYMNLSGEAVQLAANFYKISPENILCIYDDFDIPFGTLRLRTKGGPGTHNGMKSMVQHLGENFPRMRIGLKKENKADSEDLAIKMDIKKAVLKPFSKEEKAALPDLMKKAAKAVKVWLDEGIENAMNRFNNGGLEEK